MLTEKSNYKTEIGQAASQAGHPEGLHHRGGGWPQARLPRLAKWPRSKQYVEDGGRALIPGGSSASNSRGQEIDDNDALDGRSGQVGASLREKDLVLDLSGVGQLYDAGPELPLVTSYEHSRHRAGDEGRLDAASRWRAP